MVLRQSGQLLIVRSHVPILYVEVSLAKKLNPTVLLVVEGWHQ